MKQKIVSKLFRFEFYKIFKANKILSVLLAAIVLRGAWGYFYLKPVSTRTEKAYLEYCEKLYGSYNAEKHDYIIEEYTFIQETLNSFDSVNKQYQKGEISDKQFDKYMEDFAYAYTHEVAISKIKDHAEYLESKLAKTGIYGWFLYDTGWNKFFFSEVDLILLALLILIGTLTFNIEFSGKDFSRILRLTKHGRGETFYAKLLLLFVFATFASLLFVAYDFLVMSINFGNVGMEAPLFSVESYSVINTNIRLWQYLLLATVLELFGACLFIGLVAFVSELMKQQLPSVVTCSLVPILPYLLRKIGITKAYIFDMTSLIDSNTLILDSLKSKFLGCLGFAILFIGVLVVVFGLFYRLSKSDYLYGRIKL